MASLRNFTKFIQKSPAINKAGQRGLQTKAGSTKAAFAVPIASATVGIGAYLLYNQWKDERKTVSELVNPKTAYAAAAPEAQPSVWSPTKGHALYLWIHLKPNADSKACAKAVSNLQTVVDKVCPASERTDENEILAGVGFGPNFLTQVAGRARKNYNYPHRKGALGDMPSSGGDIFIHAKSDEISILFELCQEVMSRLPANSVDKFEDIYSFVYKNGRDLSGFIDGTENAADEDDRQAIAVEKETGGSYVITQKWLHRLDVIRKEKDSTMEKWVGRTRPDSIELSRKPIQSHVARMTGGNGFQQKKPFEIVRQSMPFGNVSDGAGLFFIGYAASPENFEFMLDNMVGACKDGHSDDIMRLSDCVKGTYWYFPGKSELQKLC